MRLRPQNGWPQETPLKGADQHKYNHYYIFRSKKNPANNSFNPGLIQIAIEIGIERVDFDPDSDLDSDKVKSHKTDGLDVSSLNL